MRRFWDRPLGSKLIVVLGVVLLLEMLAPWQRICVTTGSDEQRICGWRTVYSGSDFGVYAALLTVAILVWELLPVLTPPLSMRGWPTAVITAILALALAISVLVKVIDDSEFRTIWAWIGLGLALAIVLVALLRVRYRWGIRGRDEPAVAGPSQPGERPPPGPPPG